MPSFGLRDLARGPQPMGIPKSGPSLGGLLGEAWAAVSRRPVRSIMTALGTVVGTAAFTATIGITTTVGAQISEQFDLLKATEVVLQGQQPDTEGGRSEAIPEFPADSDERLARMAGVNAGGVFWRIEAPPSVVRIPALPDESSGRFLLIAASPGAIAASRPVIDGRLFDVGHINRSSRVALVGVAAARELSLPGMERLPAIFVGGVPFTVIGVIRDVERTPDILRAIVIPTTTGLELWGTPTSLSQVLIDTDPGAAQQVARQAPLALRPDDPDHYEVLVPPDPANLRQAVENDTRDLFLSLAFLSLALGAVGIANATLVAILERRPEIGLRRALGARGRHIVGQILCETALLGTAAGTIGTLFGVLVTISVALVNTWTPTLPTWTVAVSPLLGMLVGILAGLRPSLKASRISPVEALRA